MPHVRCSYCQMRRTLRQAPAAYYRLPKCQSPSCVKRQKRRGVPQRYYVDRWRAKNEVGGRRKDSPYKKRVCYPGRGGCNAYHYPHRRGSGWCVHNHNITEQEREEAGRI